MKPLEVSVQGQVHSRFIHLSSGRINQAIVIGQLTNANYFRARKQCITICVVLENLTIGSDEERPLYDDCVRNESGTLHRIDDFVHLQRGIINTNGRRNQHLAGLPV